MKLTSILSAAITAAILLSTPCLARGHHSDYSGHYAAGPTDSDHSSTYSRAAGSSYDRHLSTGWTSGHGSRTEHTHDYFRNEHGHEEHVHAYWRRSH